MEEGPRCEEKEEGRKFLGKLVKAFKDFKDVFKHPRRHPRAVFVLLYVIGVAWFGFTFWCMVVPSAGLSVEEGASGFTSFCVSLFYYIKSRGDYLGHLIEMGECLLFPFAIFLIHAIPVLLSAIH